MTRFLIQKDYEVHAQADILSDVTRGDLNRLRSAELSAQGEMEGYLNIRYDVGKIFPPIYEWISSQEYKVHDIVQRDGIFYTALHVNTDSLPADNPNNWKAGDPRSPIIVRWMVVIVLYQVYQALHGYQIPEHRVQEYDLARKWLKMAASGEIDPLLPKPNEDDTTKSIVSGGGLTRKDYEY